MSPVPPRRSRIVRRAATVLVAVAVTVPAAYARVAGPAAPSVAARPGVVAPRAAIAITRLEPGSLAAIAATSATNAWAVGDADPTFDGGGRSSPLILHWNGTTWTRSAAPAVPAGFALLGVAARSPSDAWAVGGKLLDFAHPRALILHWNGAAWSRVATPAGRDLSAVVILGPRNVWAVGTAAGRGRIVKLPLALHWNGRVWKRVRLPKLPAHFDGGLDAVSVSSRRSMWAVGMMTNCGCPSGETPLVMHFSGRSWKRQKPPAGACCFSLTGVAAISSRRAIAVGGVSDGVSPIRAQAARFDGLRWRRLRMPSPGLHLGGDFVNGVAATSSRDAWAVGITGSAEGGLVEHWNGKVWRQRPAPVALSPAVAHAVLLNAVGGTSSRNVWAVGDLRQTATFDQSALILHWNGASWSPVPTAP